MIEAVERDFLRYLYRVSEVEHIRHEDIRQQGGKKEAVIQNIEKKISWYDHMLRM